MILNDIQGKLKVPKAQRNAFGNYDYRSCEDILEAVKPLLDGAVLTLTDEIVQVGERYYVKATAVLMDSNGTVMVTTAYAREPLIRKGMDESQITGAASSYARKYALNGMFCIDDGRDSDNDEPKTPATDKAKKGLPEPNKAELDVIKRVYATLFDSAPEGLILNQDKVAKYIYGAKGGYVGDVEKVGIIVAHMASQPKIMNSVCDKQGKE